jgi:hypothetical protein
LKTQGIPEVFLEVYPEEKFQASHQSLYNMTDKSEKRAQRRTALH